MSESPVCAQQAVRAGETAVTPSDAAVAATARNPLHPPTAPALAATTPSHRIGGGGGGWSVPTERTALQSVAPGWPVGPPPTKVENPLSLLGGAARSDGDAAIDEPYDAARRAARRELMLDDEAVRRRGALEFRRYVAWRIGLYVAACVVTAGTVWIVLSWPFMAVAKTRLLSRRVSRAADAEVVIVTAADGAVEVCPVEVIAEQALELLSGSAYRAQARRRPIDLPLTHRMFVFRHTRFVLDAASGRYQQLRCEDATSIRAATPAAAIALGAADAETRLARYGRNIIDIPIPPALVLLVRECVHPFVVFQIWACIVWATEAYWSFTAFIFVTALATAGINFWEVRKNLRLIRDIAAYTTAVQVVRREGGESVASSDADFDAVRASSAGDVAVGFQSSARSLAAGGSTREVTVDSSRLVPGDIIRITGNMKLPCDCVLLSGTVTVNEAMLTGESTVVIKAPLDAGAQVNEAAAPRNTLFGGTEVVALRVRAGEAVTALVVRTGFDSVKGRLVLSILYPLTPSFKFLTQALIFITLLFILAMGGFAANAKALYDYGAEVPKIVQRGCDMVTIVVPPSLPLALTVGVAYALVALRRLRITCISPPRVNLAGKVNIWCFDKTGTLTADGLQLECVRPLVAESAAPSPAAAFVPATAALRSDAAMHDIPPAVAACLAVCQALTHVDGKLAGDPLELQTFAFSRARLYEPHLPTSTVPADAAAALAGGRAHAVIDDGHGTRHVALHVHEFVPALARMSVVTSHAVYAKGSPEAMRALCAPATVPPDYDAVLESYTKRGLRVLAAGWRRLASEADADAAIASRADAEANLSFLGFIVLVNALKPATAGVIQRLREEAAMPMHMITGDNPVAAVTVARACGLIAPGGRVILASLRQPAARLPHLPGVPGVDDAAATSVVAGEESAAGAGSPLSPGGVASWESPLPDAESVIVSPATAAAASRRNAGMSELGARLAAAFPQLQWTDVETGRDVADVFEGAAMGAAAARPTLAMTGTVFEMVVGGRGRQMAAAGAPQRRSGAASEAAVEQQLQTAVDAVLVATVVYARMSPEAKAALVTRFAAMGLYVGMVGDGANDSLALRAAHVGISLSTAEASVSAPFTSAVADISAVPAVLAEGRGALATSYQLFRFMALYSTIQFANALLIVFRGSFLSNNQYLWQDLFIVFVLAMSMGGTPSAATLTRKRPSANLLSARNLALCGAFILVTFAAQVAGFIVVQRAPWYDSAAFPAAMNPDDDAEGTNSAIPETTTVFLISTMQYAAVAAVFSDGRPWKMGVVGPCSGCCRSGRCPALPRPRNYVFTVWWAVTTAVGLVLLSAPSSWPSMQWMYSFLSLQLVPDGWRQHLTAASIVAGLAYIAVAFAIESRPWRACAKRRVPHQVLAQARAAAARRATCGGWLGAVPCCRRPTLTRNKLARLAWWGRVDGGRGQHSVGTSGSGGK